MTLRLSSFVFRMFLFLPLSLQNMFVFHYDQNLTRCGQYVQLSIGGPAANIQTAAKPKQRKLSQKLKSAFSSKNGINKLVDSTTLRRFNICFHSKISKPKCPKTQRALAGCSAQLQYGFSMWTCTFIYRVWTQTKSWKRPWLFDKFILCCFTLHSATNTPEIHKCYWIFEGVNRTQRGPNSSAGGWISACRLWASQQQLIQQIPPASASTLMFVWWRMKDGRCETSRLIFTWLLSNQTESFMYERTANISKVPRNHNDQKSVKTRRQPGWDVTFTAQTASDVITTDW